MLTPILSPPTAFTGNATARVWPFVKGRTNEGANVSGPEDHPPSYDGVYHGLSDPPDLFGLGTFLFWNRLRVDGKEIMINDPEVTRSISENGWTASDLRELKQCFNENKPKYVYPLIFSFSRDNDYAFASCSLTTHIEFGRYIEVQVFLNQQEFPLPILKLALTNHELRHARDFHYFVGSSETFKRDASGKTYIDWGELYHTISRRFVTWWRSEGSSQPPEWVDDRSFDHDDNMQLQFAEIRAWAKAKPEEKVLFEIRMGKDFGMSGIGITNTADFDRRVRQKDLPNVVRWALVAEKLEYEDWHERIRQAVSSDRYTLCRFDRLYQIYEAHWEWAKTLEYLPPP